MKENIMKLRLCANENCGKKLVRKPGESLSKFLGRKCCDVRCGNAFKAQTAALVQHDAREGDTKADKESRRRAHRALARKMKKAGLEWCEYHGGMAKNVRVVAYRGRRYAMCEVCREYTVGRVQVQDPGPMQVRAAV